MGLTLHRHHRLLLQFLPLQVLQQVFTLQNTPTQIILALDRPTSPNRVLPYVMSPSSNPVPKDPIGVNHEDLEKLELVISVLEKGI